MIIMLYRVKWIALLITQNPVKVFKKKKCLRHVKYLMESKISHNIEGINIDSEVFTNKKKC